MIKPIRLLQKRVILIPLVTLSGCGEGILSPIGPIGEAERTLLLNSLAIMLGIVITALVLTLWFAWWFRAGNTRARYLADWSYSGRLEILVWSIPTLVILFLGGVAWISSHELDPARPIDPRAKPLDLQVVAMDWKWLFIYPEQHVASINRLVVPIGVPLRLHITSATVMNVFFVPQLGSMIYAMNGMSAELNLEADKPGDYYGLSGQFSGDGFSDMMFDVQAMPQVQFTSWLNATRTQGNTLDEPAYRELLKQSMNVTPYTYHAVQPGLYDAIVMQKLPPGEGPQEGRPNPSVKPKRGGKEAI